MKTLILLAAAAAATAALAGSPDEGRPSPADVHCKVLGVFLTEEGPKIGLFCTADPDTVAPEQDDEEPKVAL